MTTVAALHDEFQEAFYGVFGGIPPAEDEDHVFTVNEPGFVLEIRVRPGQDGADPLIGIGNPEGTVTPIDILRNAENIRLAVVGDTEWDEWARVAAEGLIDAARNAVDWAHCTGFAPEWGLSSGTQKLLQRHVQTIPNTPIPRWTYPDAVAWAYPQTLSCLWARLVAALCSSRSLWSFAAEVAAILQWLDGVESRPDAIRAEHPPEAPAFSLVVGAAAPSNGPPAWAEPMYARRDAGVPLAA